MNAPYPEFNVSWVYYEQGYEVCLTCDHWDECEYSEERDYTLEYTESNEVIIEREAGSSTVLRCTDVEYFWDVYAVYEYVDNFLVDYKVKLPY